MSKIKVNNIEAASGSTVTIPSGTTLDIQGTLLGGGLSTAITNVIAGYEDPGGGGDAAIFYDFDFVSSPILQKKTDHATTGNFNIGLYHSLLLRKKFIGGVMSEVTAGCGEFFQFANSGSSQAGSNTSPWFNVGQFSSGMSFGVDAEQVSIRGYAAGTSVASSFPFGWFFTTTTTGSDQARALSRWIYEAATGMWFYVTGSRPSAASSANVGGGWWMWSEHIGWHWSRADIYPFTYINSPANWLANGSVTGAPIGWAFWKLSADKSSRARELYVYSKNKWVDPKGTGANAPLLVAIAGQSGSGQPSVVPGVANPETPSVVVTNR